MNLLPNETLFEIFKYLSPIELIRTSKYSKNIYNIIIDGNYFDFSKYDINKLLWIALSNNDIKFINWLYQNKYETNKDLILSYSIITSNSNTIMKLLKNNKYTLYEKNNKIGYEMFLLELRYRGNSEIFDKINFLNINWLKKYKNILTNISHISLTNYLIIKGCLIKKLRRLILPMPRKRLISMTIDSNL